METPVPVASDPAPAASPEPVSSEPTSSADVIRESISHLPDAGDDDGHASAEAGALGATPGEVDELAKALGIEMDGKAKWTSRVAYSKVAKIVKEREAKAAEAHKVAVDKHNQQIAQFDQLVNTPEQLLGALAQINPAYRRFLVPQQQPQAAPTRIETMEDLNRVIDGVVAQRLKPIEDERQQRTILAESHQRIARQMEDIQTWPGYTEHKAALDAAMAAEMKAAQAERRDLKPFDRIYREVVFGAQKAQRDQIRQEVNQEIASRPHATSVVKVGGGSPEAAGPRSSADIIRESIRGLK